MADRTSPGAGGNLGSAVVNALLLYGINIWPGWQVLPFLTAGMARVLDLINASLIAGIVVGVVCVLIRSRVLLAVGNLVALGFSMAAIIRVWEVFPFDFTGGWSGWPVLVRVLLVVGMVGSIIGAVAELVNLVRALAGIGPRPRRR
ncbi:hypothetical protein [Pseudarthrobacter sp. fls2-241-R2A-127]|uniref:hypothetical protein n=1 Tax=Pseudarthrobacter sp. fls2-241-R2A-127 TaxID=3040303 RepID=UPI0025565D93|nr:hypothetical protein [Pseudarthrobacter sp. fls2-241-R2A-127]